MQTGWERNTRGTRQTQEAQEYKARNRFLCFLCSFCASCVPFPSRWPQEEGNAARPNRLADSFTGSLSRSRAPLGAILFKDAAQRHAPAKADAYGVIRDFCVIVG